MLRTQGTGANPGYTASKMTLCFHQNVGSVRRARTLGTPRRKPTLSAHRTVHANPGYTASETDAQRPQNGPGEPWVHRVDIDAQLSQDRKVRQATEPAELGSEAGTVGVTMTDVVQNPDAELDPDQPGELIYVVDPMCSWCWGFAPAFRAVMDHHADLKVNVVAGGLRPGSAAQPLDDRLRAMLAHHWEQVAETSGQPFDSEVLQRQDWVYDTELADMAVVTMRTLAPHETVPFVHHLHEAFYAKAIDITDLSVYPSLVAGFDVDADDFMTALQLDEIKTATWQDFNLAQRLGATGFPTVFGFRNGEAMALTRGYIDAESFDQVVHRWLELTVPDVAPGATCSIDGVC